MGMYTELIIGCSLKEDTPKEIIDGLHGLTQGRQFNEFDCRIFLGSSYGSFPIKNTHSIVSKSDDEDSYVIDVRCHLKNDNEFIQRFLSFLKPYVYSGSGRRDIYAMSIFEDGDIVVYALYED